MLILVGSIAIGVTKSENYNQNLTLMEEIKKSFLEIQQTIHFQNMPLRESFMRISNPRCQSFFQHIERELLEGRTEEFATIWEKGVRAEENFQELGRDERALLEQIGKNMWQLHAKGAEGEISYFLAKWDERIEKRIREKREKCKMYYVCSVGSGFLLSILLL